MNLSPQWCDYLKRFGIASEHWSNVGQPNATDREIMTWAADHGHIVFTHDLDFGAILASTQAKGPSVIQVRMQDVLPSAAGLAVVNAIRSQEALLEQGALLIIDSAKARIRVLPLSR
jgi:predicted nuclease of predicted toxin-antitoxin system